MSYIDAVAYIKKQQGQLVSKEKIVENLKGAGWHDADINKVFLMVGQTELPPSGSSLEPKNTFATIAFVLGICSLFFSILILIPIAGIVFGILALKKPGQHTFAIWGLCLSGVGFLWGIVLWAVIAFGLLSTFSGSTYDSKHYYDNTSDSYYDSTYDDDSYYDDSY